jgi:hypothetical protein
MRRSSVTVRLSSEFAFATIKIRYLPPPFVNKGDRLGTLDRSEEAIAVYDDVLARFGGAAKLPLRA